MSPATSRRSALISYAASFTVLATLMALVAFGGNSLVVQRSAVDLSGSQLTAVKQP